MSKVNEWKVGDLCTVHGEGDEVFRVIEAPSEEFPSSAYLARADGKGGDLGHGREGVDKMCPWAGTVTRTSILRFLKYEVAKFEAAYAEHINTERPQDPAGQAFHDAKTIRLDAKVSILLTEIAYIARGDDLNMLEE